MARVALQGAGLHWVATSDTFELRLRNTALLRLSVKRKQLEKLHNFWLAARNPRSHAAEPPTKRVGGSHVVLCDRELEQLELGFEMDDRISRSSCDLDGIVPERRGLPGVAFERFDFAQEDTRSRTNRVGAQLGG